ncbi:LysE family transporter (plasmid) [Devosia sp. A8/3-2]|nr:LysE family transporter [Devosia sp. A8/3-2]
MSPWSELRLDRRLSISGARPAAVGATFGLAIAATLYAILTMTGLALMLTRIGWLTSLIQIAGGCYLVYLGVMAWLATKPATTAQGFGVAPAGTLRGLRMGLIVNLSNPKGVAFFIGLLLSPFHSIRRYGRSS